MADHYAIASELFQFVIEKARRDGESLTAPLDHSNQVKYPRLSGRCLIKASRLDLARDEDEIELSAERG